MAKKHKSHKPRLVKEGKIVETIDSRVMKMSIAELQEKLNELDKQRDIYLEAITTKKSERANELMAELKSLGISPALNPPRPSKAKTREKKPGAICKACGFATEPVHDTRLKAHRDQKEKKPLTDDELRASGLARI